MGADAGDWSGARADHASAENGEMSGAHRWLVSIVKGSSNLATAWWLAFAAQLRLRSTCSYEVTPEELSTIRPDSADASLAVCHAAAAVGRLAALRFDFAALCQARDVCASYADSLAEASGVDPTVELNQRMLDGWRRWLDPAAAVPVDLGVAYRSARDAGFGALAIEAQGIRALIALSDGRLAESTEIARRASRMARSEGIPDAEILANVILARVRRHQNRPHLALRILSALAPHAPPAWRGWLAWEARLCGGGSLGFEESAHVSHLAELLQAVSDAAVGSSNRSERCHASVPAMRLIGSASASPLRREAERVVALLLHADVSVSTDVDFVAWRDGSEAQPPAGMSGLVFSECGDDLVAYLLATPEPNAFRFPQLALGVVSMRYRPSVAPALVGKPQPRVDTGLAVLALRRGASIPIDRYFERVYGYPFEHAVHGSMFAMHVTRMRERIGRDGEVRRDDEGIRLVVRNAVVLRDPTCKEAFLQRVLRALAREPVSATELARRMGAPLRSVQRALKQLVAIGASVAEKQGRRVVYEVEDTTFSEPTRARRFETERRTPKST